MLEKMFVLGAAVLALTCAPAVSHAALINAGGNVTETTATLDTTLGAAYSVPHVSDGGTTTRFVTWGHTSDYFAGGGTPPVFVIDLGGNVAMDAAAFWNYGGGNSTSSFALKFATAADGTSGFGTSITYNPTFAPANLSNAIQQDFAFSQIVTARYVQLKLLDNYYTPTTGGDRVGMSEIQFNEIPEPATLSLLALGGLMMVTRRNK